MGFENDSTPEIKTRPSLMTKKGLFCSGLEYLVQKNNLMPALHTVVRKVADNLDQTKPA